MNQIEAIYRGKVSFPKSDSNLFEFVKERFQPHKGGKAQKFIAQVEKQVHTGGKVNTWAQVRLSLKNFDF